MLHFNDLTYYTIPALPAGWKAPTWLKIELGMFAGRLYFDFEEYKELCTCLGLHTSDEYALKSRTASTLDLGVKSLALLQDWLAVRRHSQDFAHTPMGYICQAKPLTADHPFFKRVGDNAEVITLSNNGPKLGSSQDQSEMREIEESRDDDLNEDELSFVNGDDGGNDEVHCESDEDHTG